MCQNTAVTLNGEKLEVVHQFQYFGSTSTDNHSLDVEISIRIGKATTTFSKLNKKVWENQHNKTPTKMNVYKVCVISTPLYGSESYTTYSSQERSCRHLLQTESRNNLPILIFFLELLHLV